MRDDPVLEPFAPEVERKVAAVRRVEVREAACDEAVRLPDLHPAVVVEDGSDHPPNGKRADDDAVSGMQVLRKTAKASARPSTPSRAAERRDESTERERD